MSMSKRWQQLLSIAQHEVEATLAALPAPVRRQAAPLPVSYEAHPERDRLNEEYDPDLLGLFIGAALAEPDESPLPPPHLRALSYLPPSQSTSDCRSETRSPPGSQRLAHWDLSVPRFNIQCDVSVKRS